MREIKFRVWDSLKKRMIYDGVEWNIGMILKNKKDFELMQFTVLKDKKGKEVYEGDILDDYDGNNNLQWRGIVCYEINRAGYEIKIIESSSLPKGTHNLMFGTGNSCYPYAEVVGNIYENLELMKGGNK